MGNKISENFPEVKKINLRGYYEHQRKINHVQYTLDNPLPTIYNKERLDEWITALV